jgi:hypothetical protein
MAQQPELPLTGGCQCGAIRYAVHAQPDHASICHCRMCQKAAGNLFGAFAGVKRAEFAWTRGQPKNFNSSAVIARDFCGDCGTPLTYRPLDKDRVSVALGSLDHPERVPVLWQLGTESRVAGFEKLSSLPGKTTGDWMPAERVAGLATHQHPDHETSKWQPRTKPSRSG